MINHIRTLLLNENPRIAGSYTCLPYAEYIPTYNPQQLTIGLKKVYSTIFPSADIAIKLVYMRQLVPVIHIPQLQPFVTLKDNRITYKFSSTDLVDITPKLDIAKLSKELDLVVNSPIVGAELFSTLTDASNLSIIWSQTTDDVIKLGSILLLFAYQVEKLWDTH